MGMIETRLGEGTFVCGRSEFFSRPLLWAITGSAKIDAHELVEARELIESETARLAAERATPEDLQEIRKHLDVMAAATDDPKTFLEADLNFHLAVAKAAHNQILGNALSLIRNLMRQWIGQALPKEGVAATALRPSQQDLRSYLQAQRYGRAQFDAGASRGDGIGPSGTQRSVTQRTDRSRWQVRFQL